MASPRYVNEWDDSYPSGGNYWSDYTDVDLKSGLDQDQHGNDGIGDTPCVIDVDNVDRYPLMAPFNMFYAGTWNGKVYHVDIISNSTISGFHFDPEEWAFIRFNVAGDSGTTGFCRVTIPKRMLWVDDGWTIIVGDQQITEYITLQDEHYTYLYFTYNHSAKTVTIQGTHIIPEFTSSAILPLLMILTIFAVALTKKEFLENRKPNHYFSNF